jgi:hypothetical protein
MHENEFTKILDWPGYRVFRHEIDEKAKTLRLLGEAGRGNRTLICSECGRQFTDAYVENRNEISESPDLLYFDENDGERIQRHGLNQHKRQNQHVRDHTSGAGIARHAF